ncbi:putative MarR family transcriptional regulator [Streptomyces sp. Tu6071]|uniref:MarR family winged helix-turn-helix transcriptional regulator n=2 Tax=Streptomyces TaxID=1883 RepID=A0ABD5E1G5_9ACTN|nr:MULTISPECIES: MarR family winged helix-turn-helix transcriptional regulator [unclassified Streptomyces]EGJ75386.1 putative MarR family transcriptional regulator [Streptomyces sp. Tu6071]MDT0415281.1 MarR family winged helix-turn-helix transcriptional regulator [Streptomyces sp. DSM 41982]SCD58313.1 DNA-binding transcriptional regulator, MarR family [Streptomyces sp. SolWspMP-sol7th]
MDDALALSALVLGLSGHLVQDMHARVSAQGFADLRPAHGFAFARISLGDATTASLGEHLGVTKQAAAQLVKELVDKGYVVRLPHPHDARARLLGLTEAGRAATRAADEAARAAVAPWRKALGEARFGELVADLARITPQGPIRPTW